MKRDWCIHCGYKEEMHPVKGVFLNCDDFQEPIVIEEHLEHWDKSAICIDPDNCPVVYASRMHQAENEKRLEYLKKHWNTHNHEPSICPDCIDYLDVFPDGFDSDLEAQRQ